MAANGMFGAGKGGMINPPDPDRMFALSMAEIAVFDRKADRIIRDLKLLLAIVKVGIVSCWILLTCKFSVFNKRELASLHRRLPPAAETDFIGIE